MSIDLTLNRTVKELRTHDNFLILCHQSPDGDTIGCAFALLHALRGMGKTAYVGCSDAIPPLFSYVVGTEKLHTDEHFSYVIAVDTASPKLLGAKYEYLAEKIDLCIDHHSSNMRYSAKLFSDSKAAAACELVYEIIKKLRCHRNPYIADCIYTGVATDTGCFRFQNTTAKTHKISGQLIEAGCEYVFINKAMFETKSLSRIKLEQMVLGTLQLHFDDRCAVISLTQQMIKKTGATEDELEGVSGMARQIEGVLVGILLREKPDKTIRVSVRTDALINAAEICTMFDGGGHRGAAGATLSCSIDEAREKLLCAVKSVLDR